jgi:hypothetical protein
LHHEPKRQYQYGYRRIQGRMKYPFSIVFLLLPLLVLPLWAQTYSARTDLTTVPYPGTIPCPASSCTGGGSLTGSNFIVTPSDFGVPITRITDKNTGGGAGNVNPNGWGIDSSAEVNFMNKNDDRFIVQSGGSAYVPLIWNALTKQQSPMYVSNFPSTNGFQFPGISQVMPFWSFTQAYIVYDLEWTSGVNAAIYSWDFTSTVTPPTRQLVVDLTTCVSPLAGLGVHGANLTVSGDDQTFEVNTGTNASTSDVYVITWNRTSGCSAWNTSTGVITGSYGGTGTVAQTDRFWIHNTRLSKDGNWVRVDIGNCTAGACNQSPQNGGNIYFWQRGTTTVKLMDAGTAQGPTGHQAIGFTHNVNEAQITGGDPFTEKLIRLNSSPSTATRLLTGSFVTCTPAGGIGNCSGHLSWANATSDTSPFFFTNCPGTGAVINEAWDSEVNAFATDLSGTVWRFAHTYGSCASNMFSPSVTIGAVSQSGKWFAWSSDWMGMLGNTDDVTASCTIGSTCRADVFMMLLPLAGTAPPVGNSGTAPATVTITVPPPPCVLPNTIVNGVCTPPAPAPSPLTIAVPPNMTCAVGSACSWTFTASGGAAPFTWSLASGQLPTGMTLSASGILSGTPLASACPSPGPCQFNISVKVTD